MKKNQHLTNIPTKNITKLNNIIYVSVKIFCDKEGFLRKNQNKMAKLGWEIRLETQKRNLCQQELW